MGRNKTGIMNSVTCNLCDKKFKRYPSYDKRRESTFCADCWENRRPECFVVMGKSIHVKCEKCGAELIVGVTKKKTAGWILCDVCRKKKEELQEKYKGSFPRSIILHDSVHAKIKRHAKKDKMTMQQVIDIALDIKEEKENR